MADGMRLAWCPSRIAGDFAAARGPKARPVRRLRSIVPMTAPRRVTATVRLLILAQFAGLAVSARELPAQDAVQAATSLKPTVSGDDFAGLEFPIAPAAGSLRFSGHRVWSWNQGDSQRLFLSGDVVVTLGTYRFEAKHAAVWIKRLGNAPGGETPGGIYQVFCALDGAGGGNASATLGISSEQLGVRAVIQSLTAPGVAADAVFTGPVDGNTELLNDVGRAFEVESRAMLARSLSRLRDPNWGEAPIAPAPYVRSLRLKNPPPVVQPAEPVDAVADGRRNRAAPPGSDSANTTGSEARRAAAERQATRSAANPPAPTSPGTPAAKVAQPAKVSGAQVAPVVSADKETGGTPLGQPAGSGAVPSPAAETATSAPAASASPSGDAQAARAVAAVAPAQSTVIAGGGEAIFAKSGIVTLLAKDVTVVSGEVENAVVASNGVVVQYSDSQTGRLLQLNAQRCVIFLEPGKLEDAARLSVESIRGLFLEGDVTVSDGKYTLRGPQIYYDLKGNRAVMLDAVFWTYDELRQLPLYVRAKSIQQTAANQFVAKQAMLTNTSLLDPEISIGTSSVTITRTDRAVRAQPLEEVGPAARLDGTQGGASAGQNASVNTQSTTLIAAENITLRAGGVPIFYWPSFSGDPSLNPIKDLRVENRSGSGAVKLTLNAYSLLGVKKPSDMKGDLLLDYYFERGLGLGTRLGWDRPGSKGSVFAYMVPIDGGTDLLKPGTEIKRDDDFRGLIVGEERWQIDDKWSLFVEGAYISDETFVDAFFEDQGETRREFTNRLRGDRLDGNTALSIEAKGSVNDFVANEWLLQSQGYSVTKLPEITYVRQADDLLVDSPGLVSYWSEYRVGALSLAFDEIKPENRGFPTQTLSERAFGLLPGQSYGDRFRALGYFEDTVYRADTRHELSLNSQVGPVRVRPFVVGRATAYDTNFDEFSPQEDDRARFYGAAGVRASTTFQRVYDGVDSDILDIHRIRHIVEPSVTAWHAGTNVHGQDLPVYDESVEALADGTIVRFGATQTLQTQRGGPGRWHTTDLLTLTTDFVVSSGETPARTPIGRFFDYRPEYANPGNYFIGDTVYRITDSTALTGGTVYNLDESEHAMTNAGVIFQHAANFSTFADWRRINALDSTYLNLGASYELTTKYTVIFNAAYDVDISGFQSTDFEVRRKFASMIFGVNLGYNDITGEASFGFIFRPYGAGGEARLNSAGNSDFGG